MPMYFNLELDSHTNKKGEKLVLLRCTYNRKHKRLSTGISIPSNFWDYGLKQVSRKHPLYKEYNAALKQKCLEVERMYMNTITENPDLSLDEFIRNLQKPKSANFFQFALDHKLSHFKAKRKLGTYRRYEAVLNKLKEFAGSHLTVKQVDYTLLKEFEIYLTQIKKNGRDTVSSNLSVIRSILNEAEKHGLYEKKNPFNLISLKYTSNTKAKLTIEELRRFNSTPLPEIPSLQLARDFFMACFFTAGCRGGDMVTMELGNIQAGNLIYRQRKTNKQLVLPVLPEFQQIIDKYKDSARKYIFPLLENESKVNEITINSKLTYINKYLREVCKYAGIFKKVSTHCARHTFSDISLDLNQNDIYGLRDVLGHSSVKTTEGYLLNRNYSKTNSYLKGISLLLNNDDNEKEGS